MHETGALNQVLLLMAFSVVSVAVFRRINLPSVLGYLLVGMLAGHHAFDWIPASSAIEQIAEIGVVFLLFTIGLEVSIPRLKSMRGIVFGIGSVQVLVSTLSTLVLGLVLGYGWQVAFAVGGALALSSTAIVVKQLTEQHELHTRYGHVSLGVLLFQDLAVVPFLVLIPIFAQPEGAGLWLPIGIALVKASLAFAVIYLVGSYLIRPLTHWVSSTYSAELFTLFILLIALTAAWLTFELGLSLAMGAFLAGIMLAETEYQHQIQTEIRPFKDVLMGLFFISVGTQFDWRVIVQEPVQVLVLTIGLVLGKGIAVALITRFGGYPLGVAIRSGIALGQGSEFGFAILGVALGAGLLTIEVSQPIIAAIVFSMAVSPLIIRHNNAITRRLCSDADDAPVQVVEQDMHKAGEEANNHVIICGFGRTGQNLARFLDGVNIPFLALEMDPYLINENWDAGKPVYYGDSSHPEVLQHAGIDHARAVVITFHDLHASEHITRVCRRLRDDIPVIVRTLDDYHLEALLEMGASEVVPDTLESSLMLAWHTLTYLGMDKGEIDDMLERARGEHYSRVRACFHSREEYEAFDNPHHLHSIEVLEGSPAIGHAIDSFLFYEKVAVRGLVRHGVRSDEPDPLAVLQAGDVLIIEGTVAETEAAELEIYSGRG
jgi:CPA2 family monovalent cation:H+ antiporter-2